MRVLAFILLVFPMALVAQHKVGINTITPDHPFQVNVDSIWTDTVTDANIPPTVAFTPGLVISPGSQKGAQRFTVEQTGFLSQLQFWFAFPTVTDELLIEVFRGAGPEGELIASKTEVSIVVGSRIVNLPQPWPSVTAGEVINIVMTPVAGASCKWKGGAYELPEYTAFHYTGTWDSITIDLAFAAFVTYMDTVEHDVLKVRDDRRVMINDYALPREDGNNGEVIQTNGNGDLSWSSLNELNVDALRDADNDTKVEVEAAPDDNIIRMTVAGQQKLTILPNGKVGLNALTPLFDLDIRGDNDTTDGGELQLATPDMTNFIRLFGGRIGDPNPFLAFSDLDTFRFVTTSPDWMTFTRRMTITPDGKLGIGTETPLARMDIQGLGDGTELLRFTTDRPWVVKQTGTGISTALTFQPTTNDKAMQILSENGANLAARFFTNNTFSKVSLVPDAGEVGIGILEATAKLHVFGNSTTNTPLLRLTESSTTDFARIKLENANEPDIFWDIAALADSSATLSKLNFYYGNPGFTGDKMTITGEGNVGIGTTSPGNRLRVNGSTTSSQHVFSAGTNYSGNIHIRAVEGFSTPASGYGIGGFFLGGSKGLESFGNGDSFSGTVTGVEGYATGTAGTRIGIYGWASGGVNNWAAKFGQGNVWIENNVRVDGNIGIGTGTPATALDINGKLKVGNDADAAQAGMIRWNSATSDFEGYDGTQWLSLTSKGLSGGWGTPVAAVHENEQGFASDGAFEDEFGSVVAISGNYAIVGSPYHNTNGNADRGKAYIFFYDGTTWSQQAILIAYDGGVSNNFGQSVATDGNYAVVGSRKDVGGNSAQGKAYVFVRNGTTWTFQASLIASDGAAGDAFGKSVAIHSDFILVGATHCDYGGHMDRGKAYIFERTGSSWPEAAILIPPDGQSFDRFGSTVSLSGAYALVGAPLHDTYGQPNSGKAYVFAWNGTSWPHQATLIADDGSATDFYGESVSLSGDYAVVGAAANDAGGYSNRGKVYVYMRSGTSWTQITKLTAPDGNALHHFGSSVSILGDQLIVGASQPNTGTPIGPGKAYLYTRVGSNWNYTAGWSAADGVNDDQFGAGVAITTNHSIVGAPFHDTASQNQRGKIYFFKKQ